MNKKIFALIIACFMSSCAMLEGPTTAGYEQLLNGWMGATENQLITVWGAPESVYESGDYKYLKWVRSNSDYIPGRSPTYQTSFIGSTAYTTSIGGSPGFNINFYCETTFVIKNEEIVGWNYKGNSCVAYPKEQ